MTKKKGRKPMVGHFDGVNYPERTMARELASPSARERLDEMNTPKHARLQIPLKDAHSLRNVADILRGLANNLDLLSRIPEANLHRDKNEAEYRALRDALWEIRAANLKISGQQKS
jgi:hypothetical protein